MGGLFMPCKIPVTMPQYMLLALASPLVWFFIGVAIVDFGLQGTADDIYTPWVLTVCWTLALMSGAIALYLMRRRYRLLYGIVELVAATGILFVGLINVANTWGRPHEAEAGELELFSWQR